MTRLRELWRRQSDSLFARTALRGAALHSEFRAANLRYRYRHHWFAVEASLTMTFVVDGEQATATVSGDPLAVMQAALEILRRNLLASEDPPETGTPPSGSM